VLAARPAVIVEFGASLGGSAISVEPHLSPSALVIADMSHGDPHHERYRDRVNEPARGYLTTEIPLDAGVVISARAPTSAT
jgi:hypothetical protein